MDDLWEDYLQYLICRCGIERETKMVVIFELLHNCRFRWVLERDENRADDGVFLRKDFRMHEYFDQHTIDEFYERGCSVMEMLVALAIRIDNYIIGDPAEPHPEIFFMEMIKNLGLDTPKTGGYYRESAVVNTINRWMNRDFDSDGSGSPFPMKYSHRDQRDVEIWDQANCYISENYV